MKRILYDWFIWVFLTHSLRWECEVSILVGCQGWGWGEVIFMSLLFSEGNLALWVALSGCLYVCMCVLCMYVTNFMRRRSSSYGAVTLVLITPLNCWLNSTPFWCKASLCTIKIGYFRTYHIARAYSTLVVLVSEHSEHICVYLLFLVGKINYFHGWGVKSF